MTSVAGIKYINLLTEELVGSTCLDVNLSSWTITQGKVSPTGFSPTLYFNNSYTTSNFSFSGNYNTYSGSPTTAAIDTSLEGKIIMYSNYIDTSGYLLGYQSSTTNYVFCLEITFGEYLGDITTTNYSGNSQTQDTYTSINCKLGGIASGATSSTSLSSIYVSTTSTDSSGVTNTAYTNIGNPSWSISSYPSSFQINLSGTDNSGNSEVLPTLTTDIYTPDNPVPSAGNIVANGSCLSAGPNFIYYKGASINANFTSVTWSDSNDTVYLKLKTAPGITGTIFDNAASNYRTDYDNNSLYKAVAGSYADILSITVYNDPPN